MAATELTEALLMGVLQGLTEFLPVSSSGHLLALKSLRHSPLVGDLTLDILLHGATLVAVLLVFRKDFAELVRGLVRGGTGRRWLFLVIVGAIPAGLVGLFLKDQLAQLGESWPWVLPVCWLFTAAALFSLRGRSEEPAGILTFKIALWIGCWQAVAILPGVSRSGITIVAALWAGCRRDEAATFSFLCATPLILGATVLQVIELLQAPGSSTSLSWAVIAVGGTAAFITGWGALTVLLAMLRRGSLHRWAYYLVAVAVAYGAWLATVGSS